MVKTLLSGRTFHFRNVIRILHQGENVEQKRERYVEVSLIYVVFSRVTFKVSNGKLARGKTLSLH